MKLSVLIIVSFVVVAKGWRQKYGNDFVTYSIGERFERGNREREGWPFSPNLFKSLRRRLSDSKRDGRV